MERHENKNGQEPKFGRILLGVGCLAAISAAVFAGTSDAVLAGTGIRGGSSMLRVTQDESSMELQLAEYLEATEGWFCRKIDNPAGGDDVILQFPFKLGDGIPKVDLLIDTSPSATEHGQVTERAVRVWFWHELPDEAKDYDTRQKVLELNNRWMQEHWAPARIVIDPDGDLIFETWVNVPGEDAPMHAEAVRDAVIRLLSAWKDYSGQLRRVVGTCRTPTSGGDEGHRYL